MVDFSETLKKLRTDRHYTQKQVAQRLGITKSMISAYETGIRMPSYDVLIGLARIYGVSTDYILKIEHKKTLLVDDLADEELALVTNLVNLLRNRR